MLNIGIPWLTEDRESSQSGTGSSTGANMGPVITSRPVLGLIAREGIGKGVRVKQSLQESWDFGRTDPKPCSGCYGQLAVRTGPTCLVICQAVLQGKAQELSSVSDQSWSSVYTWPRVKADTYFQSSCSSTQSPGAEASKQSEPNP